MNSIDESEPSFESKGPNKGILKKNPRGKQLVSSAQNFDKSKNKTTEPDGPGPCGGKEDRRNPSSSPAEMSDEIRVEKNEEHSVSAKVDETILSAGPLKKRRKIDELSFDDEDDAQKKSDENDALKKSTTSSQSFLSRLHALLTNYAEEKDRDGVILKAMEWLPHGKGFRVLRWDVLSEKVLPRYFSEWDGPNALNKHDCNGWIHLFRGILKECGFEEVKHGKEFGSYRHEVSY